MITVIIPFLNEGDEVYNTVKSIRDTAGYDVPVVLINDASTDGYDYKTVAEQLKCSYIENATRKGVALSRDTAIDQITTPYFLLLDAHMRFFTDNWHELLLEALEKEEKTLFCCQTKSIGKNEDGSIFIKKRRDTYGAFIDFVKQDLDVVWNEFDPYPEYDIVPIPCVLGAGYAGSKTFWKQLRGLTGLRSYGKDEQLISIKVWSAGGQCKLIKPIEIGHFYREAFPYTVPDSDYIFNILYIAELFLPSAMKKAIYDHAASCYMPNYAEAVNRIRSAWDSIVEQRNYYRSLFTVGIEYIIAYNRSVDKQNEDKPEDVPAS